MIVMLAAEAGDAVATEIAGEVGVAAVAVVEPVAAGVVADEEVYKILTLDRGGMAVHLLDQHHPYASLAWPADGASEL